MNWMRENGNAYLVAAIITAFALSVGMFFGVYGFMLAAVGSCIAIVLLSKGARA